jgi:hypothetical protein
MAKKKPPALGQRQKEAVNKKALYWIGGIFAGIVILMAVLLILNS